MMSDTADPLIRYLREAAVLRHAIRLNENDTAFSARGGRIHYVLDANVIRMFMDPSQHTHHLGAFAHWLDPETRVSTVTMTAEFLLSGALPGQPKGEPALISPDHFNEVIGFATRLGQRLDALSDEDYDRLEQDMKERASELDALAQALSQADIPAQEKIHALVTTLPEKVAELVRGPLAEAIQLKRCVEAGTIARIDSRSWFNADLLESNPRLEAGWFRRIRAARAELEKQRAAAGRADPHRNELTINQLSDARTLAVISRIVDLEIADDPADRCLLVTADASLRRAVEAYVADQDDGAPNSAYRVFVRHPREFVPLLNLSNMSGDRAMLEVFGQLKVVLDELLVGIDLGEESETQAVAGSDEIVRSLAFRGSIEDGKGAGRPARHIAQAKFEEFQSHWSQASALAFSMNIERMQARDKATFDAISQVVRTGDLRTQGRELIIGGLRHLLKEHAELTVEGVFGAVREAMDVRATVTAPGLIEMRVPLHLFDDEQFSDIIGKRHLLDYLRVIAKGRLDFDPSEVIARRAGEAHVQLFLACVCLAIGRWRAARDFASRACEESGAAGPRAAEAFDARYVYAIALRFTLASPGDLRQAEALLRSCADHHLAAGQRREWIRATVETAALIVAGALQTEALGLQPVGRDNPEPLLDPAVIPGQLDRAAALLNEAQRLIDDEANAEDAVWNGVRRQIDTNLAAILVLTRWLKPALGSPGLLRAIDIERVAAGLDEPLTAGETRKYTTGIYKRLILTLTAAPGDRPAARQRALEELAIVMGSGLPLPPYDQLSFEWFQDRLSADLRDDQDRPPHWQARHSS